MASSLEGSRRRLGIIIHDSDGAKAQSSARPKGSRDRGEEELKNIPLAKLNQWLKYPKATARDPDCSMTNKETANLLHEHEEKGCRS